MERVTSNRGPTVGDTGDTGDQVQVKKVKRVSETGPQGRQGATGNKGQVVEQANKGVTGDGFIRAGVRFKVQRFNRSKGQKGELGGQGPTGGDQGPQGGTVTRFDR